MITIILIGLPIFVLVGSAALLVVPLRMKKSDQARIRFLSYLGLVGLLYWSVTRLIPHFMALRIMAHHAANRSATMIGGIAFGILLSLLILRSRKKKGKQLTQPPPAECLLRCKGKVSKE